MQNQAYWIAAMAVLLTTLCLRAHAQTYVNTEWITNYGLPDSIDWTASTLDASSNLYLVGNTVTTGQEANILTSKYDEEGNLLWAKEYDYNQKRDYGVAVALDANGNIFIVGASFDGQDFDYVTIKYDEDGTQLWVKRYDGPDGDLDVPTAMATDAAGQVFVTGLSTDSTNGLDYLTIGYDSAGSTLWVSRYDYAGLDDQPAGLEIAPTGEIVVVGISADSSGTNQYAYLEYDADDGSLLLSSRKNLPGIALEKPAALAQDHAGNFYLTGSIANGSHYDIYTAKLNDSLHVDWETTFDGDSLNDEPNAIGVDLSGNVYVSGYSEDTTGKRFLTLKYNSTGLQQWKVYESSENGDAQATDLQIPFTGEIYVTGSRQTGSTIGVYTVCYDSTGEKLWEQFVDEPDPEEGNNIEVDLFGNVFVTGRSFAGGNYTYLALKYSSYQRIITAATDSAGEPIHVVDEVIIHFDPDSLLRDKIDKKEVKFGTLDQFISANLISQIEAKLDLAGYMSEAVVLKVYQDMTPADSTCVSWSGDTLEVPAFWASLVVKIPTPGPESTPPDILEVCDSLETLFPAIRYANPNSLGKLLSNDPHWISQNSLHGMSPLYENGRTDVDDSWLIYPKRGRPDVIVGVFDSGIDWAHEDFMKNSSGNLSDSKVIAGKDYGIGMGLLNQSTEGRWVTPGNTHGTNVAGIIGALTDNGKGIAGIAGGDMNNPIPNPGVSLVSMRTYEIPDGTVPMDKMSNAIIEGTIGTPGIPKLHIMNHSWAVAASEDHVDELEIAIYFAFYNQVIVVAGRGNNGNTILPTTGESPLRYPACFKEDWVLNIGACNQFGRYQQGDITTPDNDYSSGVGGNLDIIAPGNTNNIYTTSNNSTYGEFNGTSSATPHVAGVAALMISFCKDQLDQPNPLPEDIEWILEESARDVKNFFNQPYVGYDKYTGHGILNAEKALHFLDENTFELIHLEETSTQATTLYSGKNISLGRNYGPLPGGNGEIYNVDIIKVEKTFSFNLNGKILAHLSIPAQTDHEAVWTRNSSSNLWGLPDNIGSGNPDPIVPYKDIEIDLASITNSSVKAYGYYLKINSYPSSVAPTIAAQYPSLPRQINVNATNPAYLPKLAISLLAFDPNTTISIEQQDSLPIIVFPNPFSNQTEINFPPNIMDAQMALFDLGGRKMTRVEFKQKSIGKYIMSPHGLSAGVYFLQVSSKGFRRMLKVVINP